MRSHNQQKADNALKGILRRDLMNIVLAGALLGSAVAINSCKPIKTRADKMKAMIEQGARP